MDKNDVTIVGFFATEDGSSFEAYSDAAEMLREVRILSMATGRVDNIECFD